MSEKSKFAVGDLVTYKLPHTPVMRVTNITQEKDGAYSLWLVWFTSDYTAQATVVSENDVTVLPNTCKRCGQISVPSIRGMNEKHLEWCDANPGDGSGG